MQKILWLYIFLLIGVNLWAQKKEKGVLVEAELEVLMEGNYSKAEITKKAIEAAKIKAMGDKFGYAIIQGINTQSKTIQSEKITTSSSISEISNTVVKGEWISDESGFPKTKFVIREKGEEQEIWLLCEVRGHARKIEQAQVDFSAFPFNCQEPEKCSSGQFKHGDSMYLYFKSPVSGYLSVFMQEEGLVYRLLPYAQMRDTYESVVPIKADQVYRLFSPEHRDYFPNFGIVDEYGLTTAEDGSPLANMIYIIFSTEPFKKPNLSEKDGLKYISLEDFQKWLNINRGLDKNLQVKMTAITVNK
jgi:hypothetical protein